MDVNNSRADIFASLAAQVDSINCRTADLKVDLTADMIWKQVLRSIKRRLKFQRSQR